MTLVADALPPTLRVHLQPAATLTLGQTSSAPKGDVWRVSTTMVSSGWAGPTSAIRALSADEVTPRPPPPLPPFPPPPGATVMFRRGMSGRKTHGSRSAGPSSVCVATLRVPASPFSPLSLSRSLSQPPSSLINVCSAELYWNHVALTARSSSARTICSQS